MGGSNFVLIMDVLASVMSLGILWLEGNKWKHTPKLGFVYRLFVLAMVIYTHREGLLIGQVASLAILVRNSILWGRDA